MPFEMRVLQQSFLHEEMNDDKNTDESLSKLKRLSAVVLALLCL
jgi:hypothetical protein